MSIAPRPYLAPEEERVKRLSKEARREQLLEAAMAIAAESGVDALTLGSLAERAGVSKPVAYEHFGTRAGLLIALYKQIDDRQVNAFVDALARSPKRLGEVAKVMSEAYMSCYSTVGSEWHAISAALKGNGEMDAAQQEMLDGYVDLYCRALAPYSKLSSADLRLRSIGIVGAGEAISREMIRGRTSKAKAVRALADVIMRSVSS
jgi:AcrR family transcriptional regulator